jgi:hypothetical protein
VTALSVTDLVSVESLLTALGSEPAAIARRVQRLLLPSYFPNTQDGPSLVAYLLRTCPAAGQAFCSRLPGANNKGNLSLETGVKRWVV